MILNTKITSINQVLNATLDGSNELRQKYEDIKKEMNDLQSQNLVLQNKNKSQKDQIDKLLDEQKEYELKINELKDENKELKIKSINTANYKNWDTNDILIWIMSLENGRLSKYEQDLRRNLENEEVMGSHLDDVNEIDVKGWGVVKFGDKKFLSQKIQELTHKNQNIAVANEGANAPTAYI